MSEISTTSGGESMTQTTNCLKKKGVQKMKVLRVQILVVTSEDDNETVVYSHDMENMELNELVRRINGFPKPRGKKRTGK